MSGTVEVHPETINATYGDQVQINCTTESQDEHGVEWEFAISGSNHPNSICMENGNHSVKYECKREANKHTLVINNVNFNDSGTFTCTEDAGRGPGKDSSRLYVGSGSCKYSQ